MNNANFEKYVDLVFEANKNFNLTGFKTKEAIYQNLVIEILTLFKGYEKFFIDKTVADLGSGNGSPGIILKLLFQKIKKLVLIDSKHKKISFLNKLTKQLNLEKTVAICERIEVHKNYYDVICSRGLSTIIKVNDLAFSLLNSKGIIFHIKQSLDQYIEFEKSNQKNQFNLLFIKHFTSQNKKLILIALQKND